MASNRAMNFRPTHHLNEPIPMDGSGWMTARCAVRWAIVAIRPRLARLASLGVAFLMFAIFPTHASTTPKVTRFAITHWQVEGNTLLTAEAIDEVLAPGVGLDRTVQEVARILGALQRAYTDAGHSGVRVTAPRQVFSGGVVRVRVHEPPPRPLLLPPETEAESAPSPTFEVRAYEVQGNTLLPTETVNQLLGSATGDAVTFTEVQRVLGELQLAYRERGHSTVAVSLPPQQLTNATIRVQVTEGLLADIRILGNHHFSSNNVRRALPSLQTNTYLNSFVFQRELDLANQNRDRQIYPTVGPGPEPGTSAVTLRIKDRFPLHGRLEVNNHATPATPEWRINASAQYNNLWQLEHQIGINYGFTPEEFKTEGLSSDYLLNRPLISYFGGYYRLPFGNPDPVANQVQSSGAFGYDEATRQFRLPPAGARPDLTVFASGSSSDTGIQFGPAVVVSETPLLTIVSQDTGRNYSENDVVGSRISWPLAVTESSRWGLSVGLDGKRYLLESFNTNNFIITTVVTNAQGSQTIESRVSSPQPTRRNQIYYLPIQAGLDWSRTDPRGFTSANLGLGVNVLGDDDGFSALAYSPKARPEFGRLTVGLTRDQKVFQDWSLLLRLNGQAATGALISNEQFAVGGLNSVRGYYEGAEYGDHGWFGSAELRTPFLNTRVPLWTESAPVWMRGSVFMDYGQRFLYDNDRPIPSEASLWGAGFGVSANLNQAVDLRVVVGWPLRDSGESRAGDPRAYFSLGGQF